jgi:hypothetical protein
MTKTNEQWQEEVESLQCRLEIADMRINALVSAKGHAERRLFDSTELQAITIDSVDFQKMINNIRRESEFLHNQHLPLISYINIWHAEHTARAVAEALVGQLAELSHGGALYQPQAWPDAWHALRDDVLSGVDGLDNDQVNIVLGMLDNYEPEPSAAQQPYSERYYMDHNQLHDRVTGQHLWTQDQYDERYSDGLSIGRANAILEQPDSEHNAALSDQAIDTIWQALPGIDIHNTAARIGIDTNYALRIAFARAILAAATPQTRKG